jgi:hypothetical protein
MAIKVIGQVCHLCKKKANTYDAQKWWCGRNFEGHGICKTHLKLQNQQ